MKLQSIQALRGVAALLVVLMHLRVLEAKSIADNGLSEPGIIGGLFTNGYAGVDLFFVISGFIMVYVTRNTAPGARAAIEFLFARITRIYPVWWAFAGAVTLYMIAAYGLPADNADWANATGGQPAASYLLKSFLLIPQSEFPILNVGWTLIHEVYFYLVFTLLLLAPRGWLPALLAGWAVIVTAGALLGLSSHNATNLVTLIFHPMTLEFLLGAAAGLAVTNGLVWRSGLLTLLATLWLLIALGYQGEETVFLLEWGRVFWFGLPAALLVYAAAGLDFENRHIWLFPALAGALVMIALYLLTGADGTSSEEARRAATLLTVTVGGVAMLIIIWFGWLLGQGAPERLNRTRSFFRHLLNGAVKLGDWSFALYLSHLIVLSALRLVFGMLGRSDALAPLFRLGHPGLMDNLVFAVTGLVLTLLTSWLSYRMYEQPLTILFGRLRKTMFHRDQPQPAPA
ncbi:acyltransferase family protein [Hyphomonas sp.]|uniref:acyltransferase family protein n=1 Tax=Hyphomonas sp. TaxID=87 RepID=UPI0035295D87